MNYLPIGDVRAEFARRKVRFHPNEEAEDITLWGLFDWNPIRSHIASGRIIPNAGYTKKNCTIWCRPSKEEWEKHIKPLTEKYTLEELTVMAGW